MSSIYESSADDDSEDLNKSKTSLYEIWDVSQIHQEVNARYSRSKIRDCIKHTQNKWKE